MSWTKTLSTGKMSPQPYSATQGAKVETDMKNTLKQGKISIVIIGKQGEYTGICREFGFVEQGNDATEVHDRLIKASILLLNTVSKHPRLEPSLNVAPPLKYLMLFYYVAALSTIARMYYDFVQYTTAQRSNLAYV